jgi:hypothetical protein
MVGDQHDDELTMVTAAHLVGDLLACLALLAAVIIVYAMRTRIKPGEPFDPPEPW